MAIVKNHSLIELGNNIRRIRNDLGFSQEHLAEKADLDRTYIGGIERGERNVTIISILKISRALECELADIVEGIR